MLLNGKTRGVKGVQPSRKLITLNTTCCVTGSAGYIKRCRNVIHFSSLGKGMVVGARALFWPQLGGIQGSSFLESEEVHPGILVRVREDHRRPELEGMVGIVRKSYGAPEYLALDVELEDGQLELFWFYQLDAPNTDALTHSVAFYDGG